ncbi:MAG: TonB-dependent receptor plug domain-containing protein [Muribaculaceae bacterium]|nr:TonB-dependent receptor plug domain-containing protein [Muribaculaceae bacterium]
MMRRVLILMIALTVAIGAQCRKVSVDATDRPAAEVFRELMSSTGMNFVYQPELLDGVSVTVHARHRELKHVLKEMFKGTAIGFRIKGNDVILVKKKPRRVITATVRREERPQETVEIPNLLDEIVVTSRLEAPAVSTAEIGAKKLTATEIINAPALFGESDVIRALQLQPGVTGGVDGVADMHVHGGNGDENLCMLDNVPLYEVNHFAGLFSAFNPEIIRYIDFYKSSVPARYDGRLSSFLDVRTRDGHREGHHGNARLGLTSGEFDISGPIGQKTTYLAGVRRSWFDVLSIPVLALINSGTESEKIRFHYYFMDFNAKVTHRFSDKLRGHVSFYYGEDLLKTGSKDNFDDQNVSGYLFNDRYDFHYGNIVAQAGLLWRPKENHTGEFTLAYTRFFSGLKREEDELFKSIGYEDRSYIRVTYNNDINDLSLRGDMNWQPRPDMKVRYGGSFTYHIFRPERTSSIYRYNGLTTIARDSTSHYGAGEVNAYIEDEWTVSRNLMMNVGLHASMFCIGGKAHTGVSPRASFSWRPTDRLAVKAAYTRTTQYVYRLAQSYLSLPTDQWLPVTGKERPLIADKVSLGGYMSFGGGTWGASAELYYKYMHNLVDYKEEYYLVPPTEMWNARLTTGHGTAKGLDVKLEKVYGRLTGHIAYSLGWTDRTFADKNGGRTFPARFDNHHTIKILLNWKINDKVELNAAWTGHSGNRITFMPQNWEGPNIGSISSFDDPELKTSINNYQLPFYHRLDLGCTVRNSRGYWTFGLYNAYNHLNVVTLRRSYDNNGRPIFEKVDLLPIIPSVSYTWQF